MTDMAAGIVLQPVTGEDIQTLWNMQLEAFSELLQKYQDYEISPGAESMDKVMARYQQPWTHYYFIMADGQKVGAIRVVVKDGESKKRISPIWIMKEFRGRGYAQAAIYAVEKIFGPDNWSLDTILQEEGNCHLYEKLGYHRTGIIKHINERMDIVFYEKNSKGKRTQRNRNGDEKPMALTDTFVSRGKEIFGDRLEGIYLHGSSVMGCFNPRKSDIDLLVVVKDAVPDAVKAAFMDMVVELNGKAPAKGIEMDMVRKDVCRPFVYPTPFELHFSIKHLDWYRTKPTDYIQKMNGVNKDLAAYFEVIRRQGKCLCGSPIREVFGKVSREAYLDSILCDVADAEEDIQTNTAYIVLNLLRVLAFIKEDSVLSKKEGGEWGLATLPEAYRPLVQLALDEYASDRKANYSGEPLQDYARFMLAQIRGSAALQG